MPTLLIAPDVDDVRHWLTSPWREELFGPRTVRTFVDVERSNYVGPLVKVDEGPQET